MQTSWQSFLESVTNASTHSAVGNAALAHSKNAPVVETKVRWTPLPHLGVLSISGPKVGEFLQGYLTCDVREITAQQWRAGALCNLQGRMVTSFAVLTHRGEWHMRMHRDLITTTIDTLKKYAVFSRSKLRDASTEWGLIGVLGLPPTAAPGTLRRLPELGSEDDQGLMFDLPGEPFRSEIWWPLAAATAPLAAWLKTHTTCAPAAWQAAAIRAGMADVTPQTTNEYLPQMFNFDAIGAIDFAKGCYLGQEIVTRTQHRGEIKRRLYRISVSAPASQLQAGDAVEGSQGLVGHIVAVSADASSPGECLAVLNRQQIQNELRVRDRPVRLLDLPYSLEVRRA